jgi:Zn-dependent protease with chaperone function
MTVRTGSGIFLDGVTSARHDVTVELVPAGLQILGADGKPLALWAYDAIERVAGPEGALRIAQAGSPVLARLEVRDDALAAAIDQHAVKIDRSGRAERRMRLKVVIWSVAAMTSIVLVAVFGMPAIATGLAPLVPYRIERALGDAVETQLRTLLDTRKRGAAFECGRGEGEADGLAALEKLVQGLEAAAALPIPINVKVVRLPVANAFALPGGHIYVFQGLLTRADTPDELAGILAHEIGHVAHRDSTRNILQAAGLSFFFGMLLGDFVGGGAVVVASKTLLEASYSRSVEAAADAYSVELMTSISGDPHALGVILQRIAGDSAGWAKLLLDHPETRDRVAVIVAADAKPTQPLLDAAQWTALKRICSGA